MPKKYSTPETIALYNALIEREVPAHLEKWDGYKHIDIAVPQAMINIEVDGIQHNTDRKQSLSDLKRTMYSFRKGYVTLRIPNCLVRDDESIEETANHIVEIVNDSLDQLEAGEED